MPHIPRPQVEETKNRIQNAIDMINRVTFTQKDIVKYELEKALTTLKGY